MKLEVGKHYLNASGGIIKIQEKEGNEFLDASRFVFFKDGQSKGISKDDDLIAEIPTSLHQYLIQTINDYHTDLDFKATVDNVYSHS